MWVGFLIFAGALLSSTSPLFGLAPPTVVVIVDVVIVAIALLKPFW